MIQLELPFIPDDIQEHNILVRKYRVNDRLKSAETGRVFEIRRKYEIDVYGCFLLERRNKKWVEVEI